MKTYVAYVNDHGGVKGRKLVHTVVDDAFKIPRTVSGVRELVQTQNVVAILGSYGTTNTLALLPVVDELKVPLVGSLAYSNQFYSPVQPYFFSLWPGYQSLYDAQTKYIITELGKKRLAMLTRAEAAGNEAAKGIQQAVSANGGTLVAQATFNLGTADFTGPVQKLTSENPEAIIIFSGSPDVGKITQALARVHYTGIVAASIAAGDGLVLQYGGPAAEGLYGQTLVDIAGKAKGFKQYADNIAKYAPEANASESYPISGYIAAKILVSALNSITGDITAESVRGALEKMKNFDPDGLTGLISFSPSSHLGLGTVSVTVVKDGKITYTGKTTRLAG
jgi:branched-chain amino acid transport system substrate-binding protein